MKLLRNKSFSTQILILYELYVNPHSKLNTIAKKIGITQQAVSEYMKKLIQRDLVQKIEGEYKPTIKGTYLLQTELSNLKDFVEERIEKLSLIKNCVALAKTSIKSGDKVDLFMDRGWLVADADKISSSVGIANNMAKKGDYITIGNLDGIIGHNVGKIFYFELPSPFNSDPNKINLKLFHNKIITMNIDRIGVLDVVAKSICEKIGIKPDFEFGVIYSAIDAAQRGINTAIFGYDEKIREVLKIFRDINGKSSAKISYELFSIK